MKVIPIGRSDAVAAFDDCEETSGEVRKVDLPLARREFLQGSGVLMGVLASGSLLAGLAPSTAWALELKSLTTAQGNSIMALGRVLYPHAKLPDAVYALLAKALDGKAAADAGVARTLKNGIEVLDGSTPGSFVKQSAVMKLAIVKRIEGSDFFNMVRGECITALYDNDMAFATFGYPGSAWEKGGYITRGFQDLKWLPNPPAEASPPPYLG